MWLTICSSFCKRPSTLQRGPGPIHGIFHVLSTVTWQYVVFWIVLLKILMGLTFTEYCSTTQKLTLNTLILVYITFVLEGQQRKLPKLPCFLWKIPTTEYVLFFIAWWILEINDIHFPQPPEFQYKLDMNKTQNETALCYLLSSVVKNTEESARFVSFKYVFITHHYPMIRAEPIMLQIFFIMLCSDAQKSINNYYAQELANYAQNNA